MEKLHHYLSKNNLISQNPNIYIKPNENQIESLKKEGINLICQLNEFLIFKFNDGFFIVPLINHANSSYNLANLYTHGPFQGIYKLKPLKNFKIEKAFDIYILFKQFSNHYFFEEFDDRFLFQLEQESVIWYFKEGGLPLMPLRYYTFLGRPEMLAQTRIKNYLFNKFSYKEE